MKTLKAVVAISLLIALPMMLATYVYLRGEAQDLPLHAFGGESDKGCIEPYLEAGQFLISYGLMVVLFGVFPAIIFAAVAEWLVERSGKSRRRKVNAAKLTTAVLTLLLVGANSVYFSIALTQPCYIY